MSKIKIKSGVQSNPTSFQACSDRSRHGVAGDVNRTAPGFEKKPCRLRHSLIGCFNMWPSVGLSPLCCHCPLATAKWRGQSQTPLAQLYGFLGEGECRILLAPAVYKPSQFASGYSALRFDTCSQERSFYLMANAFLPPLCPPMGEPLPGPVWTTRPSISWVTLQPSTATTSVAFRRRGGGHNDSEDTPSESARPPNSHIGCTIKLRAFQILSVACFFVAPARLLPTIILIANRV